jgi:hypothetical protein
MWKITMKRWNIALIMVSSLLLLACESFPESSFELAHESRLPKWIVLPPGLSRSDVTVTMSYYVKPSGRTSTFKLLDSKKRKLAEVDGTLSGSEPIKLKNQKPGYPSGYPYYEIITVNGVKEIIEHRQIEPVFYVTDDATVSVELETPKVPE